MGRPLTEDNMTTLQRITSKRCFRKWYCLYLAITTISLLCLAVCLYARTVLSPVPATKIRKPIFVTQTEMMSKRDKNSSRTHELLGNNVENRTSAVTSSSAGTRVKSTLERDRLMKAAAAIKSHSIPLSHVSHHASHEYFHLSQSNFVRNFSHFLINPTHVCSESGESGHESPFLVVLVLSSYLPPAAKEREAIRVTYGSVTTGQQWPGGRPLVAPVTMVFLLGLPPTTKHRRLIETENAKFRDMLVADFVDSYRNLTLKVLHGLYWVLHNCPQVKFVLKTDDDVFVNLPLLTSFLYVRGKNNSLYGYVLTGGSVRRKGRWAVSEDVYPLSTYPLYISGTAYVMSMDAAQKIVEASSKLPLIPIEDAFITGILAQITKVVRVRTSGFTHNTGRKANMCDLVRDTHLVAGDRMKAFDKWRLWTDFSYSNHPSCS